MSQPSDSEKQISQLIRDAERRGNSKAIIAINFETIKDNLDLWANFCMMCEDFSQRLVIFKTRSNDMLDVEAQSMATTARIPVVFLEFGDTFSDAMNRHNFKIDHIIDTFDKLSTRH